MPWPPPTITTGSSVVCWLPSVVVIHSFSVYEVPGSVVAISSGGMEVSVLVTPVKVPVESVAA